MSYSRALEIAAKIKDVTTVDVFEKRRTLQIVDARAMFCYILRVDLKYKSVEIREIIREFRPYDHATVLYMVKIYESDVRYRRPDLEELRLQLINQYSPYFVMLTKAKGIEDEDLMEQIINLIDTYETTKQKRVDIFDASCAWGRHTFTNYNRNRMANFTPLTRIKKVMRFYYNRGVNSERVNKIYKKILSDKYKLVN